MVHAIDGPDPHPEATTTSSDAITDTAGSSKASDDDVAANDPEPAPGPHPTDEEPPDALGFGWLRSLIAIALTAAVMWLLFREFSGLEASGQTLARADWSYAGWTLALLAFTLIVSVQKWRYVLSRMGHRIPYRTGVYALLAAWPFSAITPSRAGDLMRCMGIREHVPLLRGSASILIDRLFDVQSLALLALAGALSMGWWSLASGLAATLVVAWLFGLWILGRRASFGRIPGLRERLALVQELLDAVTHIVHVPRASLTLTGYSLLNWVAVQGIFYLLLATFGADIGPIAALTLWPIATLTGLVPVTLSGMGTRDVTFLYLVESATGVAPDASATLIATFSYSLFSAWIFAVIGTPLAIHMLMVRRRPAVVHPRQASR